MLDREEESSSILCSRLYITRCLILMLWLKRPGCCYLPSADMEGRLGGGQWLAQVHIGQFQVFGLQRLVDLGDPGQGGTSKMMTWTGTKLRQVVNPTKDLKQLWPQDTRPSLSARTLGEKFWPSETEEGPAPRKGKHRRWEHSSDLEAVSGTYAF